MHKSVRWLTAKNQEDSVNHKNKKSTSILGYDSFIGRKEKEAWGKSGRGTTCDPMYCRGIESCLGHMDCRQIVRPFIVSRPPTEERESIPCFVESIIMSSTLLRIFGPSKGFFTRSLGRGPWSSPNRNLRYRGTLYLTIREKRWWLWWSMGT